MTRLGARHKRTVLVGYILLMIVRDATIARDCLVYRGPKSLTWIKEKEIGSE